MYAVIETGGKQYRVQPGDVIDVERSLEGAEGSTVTFDRVLLVGGDGVKAGEDVAKATVSAVVVGEVRGPKLIVFKKKRRKGYKRRNGHRQDLLRVRIEAIEA
jgi:large subunit ribosomal protein L21